MGKSGKKGSEQREDMKSKAARRRKTDILEKLNVYPILHTYVFASNQYNDTNSSIQQSVAVV